MKYGCEQFEFIVYVISLAGKTGTIRFDESGDRETEHSVQHYQQGKWQEVAIIDSGEGQAYRFLHKLIWHGSDKLPSDTPDCGFNGRVCSGISSSISIIHSHNDNVLCSELKWSV